MMGQQAGDLERLFYSFNLDDHIPADHLLRGIDGQCRSPRAHYLL
jgi:hypothetical protein